MTNNSIDLAYRQSTLAKLFNLIASQESCALVGAVGMGKSRVARHFAKPEVQRHFLGDATANTLIAFCDCNRMDSDGATEWAVCELILTALIEAAGQHPRAQDVRIELNALRREIITNRDALLARRHMELAILMLCRERDLHVCLAFDAFDEPLRALPARALTGLRALRDDNKNRLTYTLFMSKHPAQVRPPSEYESFYWLFARSIIGLGPYAQDDAARVIADVQARRSLVLSKDVMREIAVWSGGHSGYIVALCDALAKDSDLAASAWATYPVVQDISRRLWQSLEADEQLALREIASGQPTANTTATDMLALQGIISNAHTALPKIFSPLFMHYVHHHGAITGQTLSVDERAHVAWIGQSRVDDLTPREFNLLALLAQRPGDVFERRDILMALNPDELYTESLDNSVDALVKRVRKKIEPDPSHPRSFAQRAWQRLQAGDIAELARAK